MACELRPEGRRGLLLEKVCVWGGSVPARGKCMLEEGPCQPLRGLGFQTLVCWW